MKRQGVRLCQQAQAKGTSGETIGEIIPDKVRTTKHKRDRGDKWGDSRDTGAKHLVGSNSLREFTPTAKLGGNKTKTSFRAAMKGGYPYSQRTWVYVS